MYGNKSTALGLIMKKLIFVLDTMVLGGIERSFLDLCLILPKEEYEITLILKELRGELLAELPEWIKVIQLPLPEEAYLESVHGRIAALLWSIKHVKVKYLWYTFWARLLWYLRGKSISFDYPALTKNLKLTRNVLNCTYDLAIAYYGDYEFAPCVVLNYIDAKKKICWTHSERPDNQMSKGLQKYYYSKFDYRFACSKTTAERINQALNCPNLVKGVPHVIDADRIRKLAEAERVCHASDNVPVVLTVARLDYQKGIDIAIKVHKLLLDDKYYHHWYVVGNAHNIDYLDKLKKSISHLGVKNTFFLEGGRKNPYPYFKRCTIYVQPSRFEGYCLTVAEARTFCKPIVATDFDGAREQLRPSITGTIVNCNEMDIASAIKALLENQELCEKFNKNLAKENSDTKSQVLNFWRGL